MSSHWKPPVKRARSEVGEIFSTGIKKELEEEVDMEDMEMNREVANHLKEALEATVVDLWQSVSSWKEKEKEKEKRSNYLNNLLVKSNIKEREGLEDTIKQLKEEVSKEKCEREGLEDTIKQLKEELDREKCQNKQSTELLKEFESTVISLQNESEKSARLEYEMRGLKRQSQQRQRSMIV